MTRYLPWFNICVRFSPAVLLLGVSLVVSISATSAKAQSSADGNGPAATADPKADLKTSMNALLTLRQNEVQRLEKRQTQSADLYRDGIISRVEFETGEKALADARTKVEDINKQI